jgi:hypothetical protein
LNNADGRVYNQNYEIFYSVGSSVITALIQDVNKFHSDLRRTVVDIPTVGQPAGPDLTGDGKGRWVRVIRC